MDWTVKDRASANHNPLAVVNGEPGRAPVTLAAEVGTPLGWTPREHPIPKGSRHVPMDVLCRGRHWRA